MKKDKLLEEVTRLYDAAIAKWHMASEGTLLQAYYDGESNGIDLIKNLIIQLDEPEKVVIPKFVADAFDYKKRTCYQVDEAKDIPHILKCAFGNGGKPSKFLDWVRENSEDYVMAVKNGYEIEKEPLYYVRLMSDGYLNQNTDGNVIFVDNKNEFSRFKTKFTKSEIKAIDERYWQFAEPVEEEE